MKFLAMMLVLYAPVTQTDPIGGICIGKSWLPSSSSIDRERGPDFRVDGFETEHGTVNVYAGCCSQVSTSRKTAFMRSAGHTIWRVSSKGEFQGYLIRTKGALGRTKIVTDYHFFGPGIKDAPTDRSFFKRLSLIEGRNHQCT